jgi:iron complex outermembrane receptor protein
MGLGPAAWAGEDLFGFYAEEATVVAAAKRPQTLAEAPASAHVLTAEDIALFGYRTLGEALQSIPGFYVTTDRNYSYLCVRGFGPPGDYNSRILLLVNGHRMNENIYGGAFVGHDFSLDLRAVERIEVIPGPGSALYGDSAFFAVVNVVTRDAGKGPSASTSAEAGSFGTQAGFADVAVRGRGVSGYTAASYRFMRGQDLAYPELGGGAARDADREESMTLYTHWHRGGWQLHANAANRRKRIPTASYGTLFGSTGSETSDGRAFLELRTERTLPGAFQLMARAYHDWYRYHGDYVYADDAQGFLVNKDVGRARWYGEEIHLQRELPGRGHRLMLGQEFERNLAGQQVNFDVAPRAVYLRSDLRPHRWALFAQDESRPHPRLGLTTGLRYDRYESFGGTLNPRIAAVLHLTDSQRLKFVYGSAFRAPTPYDLAYEGFGQAANAALQPERVRSLEVAGETRAGGIGQFSIAGFHNRIDKLIRQSLTSDGDIVSINDEEVEACGLEASLRLRLPAETLLRAGGVLQRARTAEGARISNAPRYVATLGLVRRFAATSLAAESFLIGPRRTVQGTALPATALVSLRATLQARDRDLRFEAGAYNLFDIEYRASGAGEHVQSSIAQDGRSFCLGVFYRMGNR